MIGGKEVERSKSVSSLHEKNGEEAKTRKKLPSIHHIFSGALQGTQHEGLKVLTSNSIYKAYEDFIENNPDENLTKISEFSHDECLATFMTDVSVLFTE